MKFLTLIIATIILIFTAPITGRANDAADNVITVDVNGLVCDFCARALEKVFAKQDTVSSIDVDLENAKVIIHLQDGASLTDDVITQLITDSGYNVRGITHE